MTPNEARMAYGAVSDIAQVLMHSHSYSNDELVTRVRALSTCHAWTLYNLAEDKIFESLPENIQKEVVDINTFCHTKTATLCSK